MKYQHFEIRTNKHGCKFSCENNRALFILFVLVDCVLIAARRNNVKSGITPWLSLSDPCTKEERNHPPSKNAFFLALVTSGQPCSRILTMAPGIEKFIEATNGILFGCPWPKKSFRGWMEAEASCTAHRWIVNCTVTWVVLSLLVSFQSIRIEDFIRLYANVYWPGELLSTILRMLLKYWFTNCLWRR